MVDLQEGVLGIEWIEGKSIRFLLGGGAEGEEEEEEEEAPEDLDQDDQILETDTLLGYNITKGNFSC